jgi:hypothetical protein
MPNNLEPDHWLADARRTQRFCVRRCGGQTRRAEMMPTSKSVILQPYFVEYAVFAPTDVVEDLTSHIFCGPQSIAGADCPNCERPLLRFLTLHTEDSRLGLSGMKAGSLHLLYCWQCNVAQDNFRYAITAEGAVELIANGVGGVEPDFPYHDYPVFFPGGQANLVKMTDATQAAIRSYNSSKSRYSDLRSNFPDASRCRHQVGGEPFLIQRNPDYAHDMADVLKCSQCGKFMPFLAAVSDDCLDERGFTGDASVQVLYHFCKRCLEFVAFHQVG